MTANDQASIDLLLMNAYIKDGKLPSSEEIKKDISDIDQINDLGAELKELGILED